MENALAGGSFLRKNAGKTHIFHSFFAFVMIFLLFVGQV
jgi:hypothetical protein